MSTIVINTMYTQWPQKELRSVVVFRCHLHPVLFYFIFFVEFCLFFLVDYSIYTDPISQV
jgi:hypothetical protein